MTVVNNWCFPSLHLLQCEQTGTAHRIVFVLCSVRLQPAACCHLPFFIHFFYVWLIKPPCDQHSPGRRAWESPAAPTEMLFVCFWLDLAIVRSDMDFFPRRYRSRCIVTSRGKRKSDRIVKPWERVIQITEVVEVFARKTNLRELVKLEVWSTTETRHLHLFAHDSWFSRLHSFFATFSFFTLRSNAADEEPAPVSS